MFNEDEKEAKPEPAEPTVETITYKRRKQQRPGAAVLKDLPVETIEYSLPPEEQVCPNCGGPLHEMSIEVRQELKIIPAQAKLVKHMRHVYSYRRCEREDMNTPVITCSCSISGKTGEPGISLGRCVHYEQKVCGWSSSLPPGTAVFAPESGTLPTDHGQVGA